MHCSQWSYNKTATHQRQESPDFSREIELIDSIVWVTTTTLLCSIFLPVLVKAIPCTGKDLKMCTEAYASLTVELQQDSYSSKTRESRLFGKGTIKLIDSIVWVTTTSLLCSIFLPVLVKAIPCIGKDLRMCTEAYASLTVELQQDGYSSKTRECFTMLCWNASCLICWLSIYLSLTGEPWVSGSD